MTPSQQPALNASEQASSSDDWCTPAELANDLGEFDLDPCSNARSHVRTFNRICLPADGLASDWIGSVFVNPPYSSPMPWCMRLALHRGPWVALLKLDPTTRWFAALVRSGASWSPFRKRIAFERPDKPPMVANFPSVLVWHWWTPSAEIAERLWVIR